MNKWVAICAPLAAAVLVAVGLGAPDRDAPKRSPRSVDASSVTYACPAGSVITVAAGQVASGAQRLATAGPDGAPVQSLDDAGAWQTGVVNAPGVVVTQTGTATGAVGFFAGSAPKAGGGGLVVGQCPQNTDDAWFLGLGAGGKHFSTLILSNTSTDVAVASVQLWGPSGAIETVNADRIVIEPGQVRRIRVDDVAAGETEMAARVVRRQGQVAVAVNDTMTGDQRGTEAISPSAAPSQRQVIAGVVPGKGRSLLLFNPSGEVARASVSVLSSQTAVTPTGLDAIEVPAGSVASVDIPDDAGAGELAVQVQSDQPLVSSVRMALGSADFAYAESSAALRGPAILPLDLGRSSRTTRIVATAPNDNATLDVRAFDASMNELARQQVRLAAKMAQGIKVDVTDAAYVVVTPQGEVNAAATYYRGQELASLSLSEAPVRVAAPDVRPAG